MIPSRPAYTGRLINAAIESSAGLRSMVFFCLLAWGCGGATSATLAETGGASSAGGDGSGITGGQRSTGGNSSSASPADSGGSVSSGGVSSTGGSKATGGVHSAGGLPATGGSLATGGTSSTGGTTSSDCNSLVNAAPVVTITVIAEAAPAPKGGIATEGTYYLTQYQAYTGVGGLTNLNSALTYQYTLVVSSSNSAGYKIQLAVAYTIAGTPSLLEGNGYVSTNGTTYTSHIECSTISTAGATGHYTATADEILMFDDSGSTKMVATYTRQH